MDRLVSCAVGACAGAVAYHLLTRSRTDERSKPEPPAFTRTPSPAQPVLSRQVPLVLGESAIIIIDVQNFCCHPKGGEWVTERPTSYFLERLPHVIGNIRALLEAARQSGVECIFTVIESLTADGRDRSLDYKVSGFNVPKGSWDARVIDEIAPTADEIVLPKCSSSVFISTNLAYKLRNLGVKQVVLVGGLTDQCVDSAVRDACDLGFLVTCVTDACITKSAGRHASALANSAGYARQLTTLQLLPELLGARAPTQVFPCVSPWAGCGGGSAAPPVTASSATAVAAAALASHAGPREYVRFEVTDFNGKSLSKVVPGRHKGERVYMYSGAAALGANAEVLTIPDEVMAAGCPNTALVPDWATLVELPWASAPPDGRGPAAGVRVSRVLCEQHSVSGAGVGGVASAVPLPRTVCKRLLDELWSRHGLKLLAASELEFSVAHAGEWSQPVCDGPEIFTTLQYAKLGAFTYQVEEAMARVGVDVRTMNTEYGSGQLEITFSPSFGLQAADDACTFRTCVKELAQQRGWLASFMSKTFSLDGPGNGGHLNFSLWQLAEGAGAGGAAAEAGSSIAAITAGHTSALHDASAPDGLSADGKHFLAGVLAHAPALEALCSPTPCCYLRHGHWAPTHANHGPDDRSAAVRTKAYPHSTAGGGTYFECRMPSASACAYLVIAGVVAAGLDGLARALPLPPARQGGADGAAKLPTSLSEALRALEADTHLVDALGADFVRWFVGLKRGELDYVDKKAVELREAHQMAEGDAKMGAWMRAYMEFL
jgi:ureidoacrylate peracid hydrolase